MARPMRLKGVYHFRQRVPKDVLPRVGKSWIKESLRTSDPAVAKQRHTDASAKYAAYWNELRRSPPGMDAREATAIAGEVYKKFLERHRDGARTMRTAHHWSWRAAVLAVAPGEEDKPSGWDGVKTPDWDIFERDAGDELRTVLRRAGMALDDASFRSLLFKSAKAVLLGIHKLIRECGDDFRPDPEAERFPAFVAPKDKAAKSTLVEDIWDAVKAGLSPSSQKKYRHALDDFLEHLGRNGLRKVKGDYDLSLITKDNVRAWRDDLLVRLDGKAAPRTIERDYLGSLKAVFSFAVRDDRIAENCAKGILVQAAWRSKAKKMRGLHDDEIGIILRASLLPKGARVSQRVADAMRWVPWLCAYTGARVSEITRLRGKDVRSMDGHWCIHITPEAGGQKSETDRDVPLHEHLMEQGFLDFSRGFRPSEPLFHYYEMPEVRGDLNDREEHRERAASAAANVSGRLSKWVRSLGVKDPDVDPNHGWRHRFKTEGRAVGMDPIKLDAIQGHIPPGIGAKYGNFAPRITAPQIAMLPRIAWAGL
jgi:integrase